MLTIHAANAEGARQCELDSGVTLYDVTHLACRSARHTPTAGDGIQYTGNGETGYISGNFWR